MKSFEMWASFSLLLMLAGYSAAQAPAARPDQTDAKAPAFLEAKPLKEDPKDDELRKLLKARYNEALAAAQGYRTLYQSARVSFHDLGEAQQRLMQAGLELCETPADKIALYTRLVELDKNVEEVAKARMDAARGTEAELHRARYQRLDAEVQLFRAKREADKAKGK